MFEVIYLTGAPASGKTTLTKDLRSRLTELEVFDYGEELRRHVEVRDGRQLSYEQLRTVSANLVTQDDVRAVDDKLLVWASERRAKAHVIVDSHAVTREEFGFCVSPFRRDQLEALRPSRVVCLFARPATTMDRISKGADGRLNVTEFEAGFHTGLQASVAATYAIHLGCRVYLFDTSEGLVKAMQWFQSKLDGKWREPTL